MNKYVVESLDPKDILSGYVVDFRKMDICFLLINPFLAVV